MKRHVLIVLLTILAGSVSAWAKEGDKLNKLAYWYCIGMNWLDNFCLNEVDTTYIGLPDNEWRIAFTNSTLGIHSTYSTNNPVDDIPPELPQMGDVTLHSLTTPSLDLGFQVGLRSVNFGYTWDALHAYSQKLNFSLGGKSWGVELLRQKSSNIRTGVEIKNWGITNQFLPDNIIHITNTNLTAWYALNSPHYSHNAAIKQSYIQKKTAGSLLLSLSYLNTDMSFNNDTTFKDLVSTLFLGNVQKMVTHQVAVGLGYGINYTPNNGKVLIHFSAYAQAVFYSINYVSYVDTLYHSHMAYPSYTIKPKTPVHFTGNMRAAVSWEINKWVHLNARAQVDNIRFDAQTEKGKAFLSNWNWQVYLTIAARIGVGEKKRHKIIEEGNDGNFIPFEHKAPSKTRMPQWITGYFFSPT